jgi:alpha-beta hydrolase superfamily lysophospholipase
MGWQTHEATTSLRDLTLTRSTAVYYPAAEPSEDATVATETGPLSAVFFEHASGAHYLAYEIVFQHLASHGIAGICIDHNALDGATG